MFACALDLGYKEDAIGADDVGPRCESWCTQLESLSSHKVCMRMFSVFLKTCMCVCVTFEGQFWMLTGGSGKERAITKPLGYPLLWHCWLGDRKDIRPVKCSVLVCCWWRFDWSCARLVAPVVTTTTSIILSSNKIQIRYILVPASPGLLGKWPLNGRVRWLLSLSRHPIVSIRTALTGTRILLIWPLATTTSVIFATVKFTMTAWYWRLNVDCPRIWPISEMTYTVSSGTLNSSIPYLEYGHQGCSWCLLLLLPAGCCKAANWPY